MRQGMTRSKLRTRTGLIVGVVAALMLTALTAPTAHGATRDRKVSLASGVEYIKARVSGPNQIKMIVIDPQSNATVDVALARNTLPGYSHTSDMATAHNALAAINGDFGLSPGRPGHAAAEDGQFLQSSPLGNDGKNFAIRADETKAFIGGPAIALDVHRVTANKHLSVERWNDGDPRSSEIAGYTAFGGTVSKPPRNACSARLVPNGGLGWGPSDLGVQRNYTVDAVACGSTAMTLGQGIVISTPSSGTRANDIKALSNGEAVRLTWSLGWPGVLDAMGGSPILIENNKIMVSSCGSYLCKRHPRSAVGIKSNGDIMFFQVDGRRSTSVGMTLVELAREMQRRGAVWAMNLDGGGSSTMWVRGKGVVNVPSDGDERSVTSALIVLPGGDAGDPSGMLNGPVLAGAAAATPFEEAAAAEAEADFGAAVTDPASTGGLLDAMANGDLGSGRRVPMSAEDLLHDFRIAIGD